MTAAIRFWKLYLPQRPHVAVLGDMLELGDSSVLYHKAICDELKGFNATIISVGTESKAYQAKHEFENVDELLNSEVLKTIPEDAVVLLKASNGIKLKKLIGRL